MVPYLKANPQITYAEAAADLGVTRKQLQQDLDQLWMCGLPGYGPGDLIDFEFSGDTINVTFTAGVDAPLRLTSPEATGLLVALRALVDIPGVVDPQAARSAIAKIESAAGTIATTRPTPPPRSTSRPRSRARPPPPSAPRCAPTVRSASSTTRPPATCCPPASSTRSGWSSSVTTATWRHGRVRPRGAAVRFDRIVEADILDEPSAPPAPAVQAAPDTSLFDADPALPAATLLVAPSASWMLEYYPMRVHAELPDGYREAAMTYASDEWMARLVLGFGPDVRVLAPDSLVERVRGRPPPRWRRTPNWTAEWRRRGCRGPAWGSIEQTSGGDQIGCSTTVALADPYRRRGAALRVEAVA